MTALEVKRIRLMLGMSHRVLGKAIGLSQSAMVLMENGGMAVDKHEEKIKQVLRDHIAIKKLSMAQEIAFLEFLLQ